MRFLFELVFVPLEIGGSGLSIGSSDFLFLFPVVFLFLYLSLFRFLLRGRSFDSPSLTSELVSESETTSFSVLLFIRSRLVLNFPFVSFLRLFFSSDLKVTGTKRKLDVMLGRGGGIIPSNDHMGMCHSLVYGFQADFV